MNPIEPIENAVLNKQMVPLIVLNKSWKINDITGIL